MTLHPIPAASAFLLSDLELPRATPTIDNADPAGPAPAGDAGGQLGLDSKGQPWDVAVHVVPPRRNVRGEWARKPGNAQRKAKGAPPSGRPFSSAPAAPGAGPDAIPTKPDKPEAGPISDMGLASAPAGPGPGAPAGDPAPMPETPLEDYKASGESLGRGFFAGMAIWMGHAWEPDGGELPALAGAIQRSMHHFQTPRVNPLIELFTVLASIFAKRRNDPATKAKAGGLFGRFGWGRKSGGAPADPPEAQTPASGTITPAIRRPHEFG